MHIDGGTLLRDVRDSDSDYYSESESQADFNLRGGLDRCRR